MGWWDDGILGGDEPLDCFAYYEKATGVKPMYPLEKLSAGDVQRIRVHIEADPMAWLEIGRAPGKGWSAPVRTQIGAFIAMAVGAKLPEEYKKEAIELIRQDEWMQEEGADSSRGRKILEFIQQLRDSDGTPKEPEPDPGLLVPLAATPEAEHKFDDWVEPVAARIADMIPSDSLDEEDRKKLKSVLTRAFTLCPAAVEPLIGTGIIEEDYFKDLRKEEQED